MEVMSQIVSIHEERNPLPTGAGDAPMIKGVKVLGVESKNGRKYPVEVMRKALEKYDGAMVNIDHPKGDEPRSYEDRFGRLVNPRLEADGIYADLSYNPKHPLAEGFAWWAANDPSAVGLSHNAQARTKLNREGVEEIEEIVEVTSVDLVAEPATTAGLMECVMKAKAVKESTSKAYDAGLEDGFSGSVKRDDSKSFANQNERYSYQQGYKDGQKAKDAAMNKGFKEEEKKFNSLASWKSAAKKAGADRFRDDPWTFGDATIAYIGSQAIGVFSRMTGAGTLDFSAINRVKPAKEEDKVIPKPKVRVEAGKRKEYVIPVTWPKGGHEADYHFERYSWEGTSEQDAVNGLMNYLEKEWKKFEKINAGRPTAGTGRPMTPWPGKNAFRIGQVEVAYESKEAAPSKKLRTTKKTDRQSLADFYNIGQGIGVQYWDGTGGVVTGHDKDGDVIAKFTGDPKEVGEKNDKFVKGKAEFYFYNYESKEADYKSMNDRFDARVKQLAKDGYKQVKPNIFAKNDIGFTNKQIMRMSDDEWNNFRGFGQPVSQLIAKKESDDMEPELFPAEKENDEGNGYEDSLKDQIGDIIMDDELHAEEKVAKLLALITGGQEEPEEAPVAEAEDMDEEPKEEQDEEEDKPKNTEESLRRKPSPAVARLLEEVDAYRARDRREKAVTEARKFCSDASLPTYAITESFLGILADVDKKQWKTLVEDRRRVIFRGEKPISSVPADGKLTVDSLVKALRS